MKIRFTLVLLLSLAGVGLTTFIIQEKTEKKAQQQLKAIKILNDIKDMDHQLNQLLLQARSGMTPHYDEIANLTRNLLYQYDNFIELHESLPNSFDQRLNIKAEELYTNIDNKLNQIDSFKSKNAIFRNSSNYFPELSELLIKYAKRANDTPLTELTQKLNASVYQYLVFNDIINRQLVSRKINHLKRYFTEESTENNVPLINEFESHLKVILDNNEDSKRMLVRAIETPTNQSVLDIEKFYIRTHKEQLQRSVFLRNLLLTYGAILLVTMFFLATSFGFSKKAVHH